MSWFSKLLKAIKIFCVCKSSCIVSEDVRITFDNTHEHFQFKISTI